MIQLINDDALRVLPTLAGGSVHCCVTSPPYFGLRDYGVSGQIGLESTPAEYVAKLVEVFRGVRRVLADNGTLWLNLGDSYAGGGGGNYTKGTRNNNGQNVTNVRNRSDWLAAAGAKPKDLLGIPWRVAFALQADGWYLRSEIIWHKPNPMPESVRDRPTKAHEQLFLLAKGERYYYDAEATREENSPTSRTGGVYRKEWKYAPLKSGTKKSVNSVGVPIPRNGRNRRSVWTVATKPFRGAHFATFPPKLIEPCILAGCPEGGTVLDPFNGAGTTGLVAIQHGRKYVGIELNAEYMELARQRLAEFTSGNLFAGAAP